MAKLICLLGVIGSGKSYQANKFIEDAKLQGKEMVHINFADELREMAWDILGWRPLNEFEYEKFKTMSLTSCNVYPPFKYDGGFAGGKLEIIPNHIEITGREFLQRLGTEAMRKRDKNFWAKCWSKKVKTILLENNFVVCSDLRFINELSTALLGFDDIKFIFSNFISDRYDSMDTHESEQLAQRILKDGFKDGQQIQREYLEYLINKLG